MLTPQKTITIKSDGNILTYKDTLKPLPKGELHYVYEYTKSLTKKGTMLGLTEKELEKLISTNL